LDSVFLLQLGANGISVGMGYALAAVGLALVFGILEQVNFAHGEIYMVGAFSLYAFAKLAGLPYATAFVLTLCVMAVLGYALAELAFIPTLDRPFEAAILATFALSVILQNAVRLIFGASPKQVEAPFESFTLEWGGVLFFGQRMFVVAIVLIAFAGLVAFLRTTTTGRAMRAVAQNKDAAVMVGIDIRRITRITATLGAVLTGLAAGAIAPLFDLYPNMGTDVVFKSFAVVIIGGMGNIAGSVVAGSILGIAESFAGGLVDTSIRDGIGFALMILMLLVRPQGLFGKSVRV
jgi:branched-chain amino acid transport system permease protein